MRGERGLRGDIDTVLPYGDLTAAQGPGSGSRDLSDVIELQLLRMNTKPFGPESPRTHYHLLCYMFKVLQPFHRYTDTLSQSKMLLLLLNDWTGFFRTSINELFEVSGPMLRLERRDSRRDFTAGSDAGTPPQDPGPV
ncbi:hypothetical protein EYF80_002140 [Liparis tanakae]|uniref:Uncharacterized protein n=1 Tax=Liparis tanakae TaxID=230148 RepID=A0A4Z2JCC3_9TELE|nr:hypothetical protein EYF80_002140 [Liparis tanakae]